TPARPLPINNRVVMHLLEALQMLRVKVPGGGPAEARRLSFRSLDVEQIGHVYEGLLDHTARRAEEPVLGLAGTRGREPEIPLSKLEQLAGDCHGASDQSRASEEFLEFLNQETGRSLPTLKRALEGPTEVDDHDLLIVCGHDAQLISRIRRFANLLR